ncbi:MAG: FRG domain-containing protein [Negativicutes bacterium]|nr:FRG domain-containing protein [Negativicutes bacterium]
MNYNSIKIQSWRELVDILESLQVQDDPLVWYLRGQADADWQLLPSFLRAVDTGIADHRDACEIENLALKLFQSQAHLYLKPDIIDRNSWSRVAWWSLMQHYSCPTRLLDWTRSPYVAAYFAVDQCLDRDGAVWFFPAPQLEQIMRSRYGPLAETDAAEFTACGDRQAVYPVLGSQHTQRSAAQQGVFTVSTYILADHGAVIADALAHRQGIERLTKLVIPAVLKHEFLSRLHTMNITAKTLFPGIDGMGRSVSEIISLRFWRRTAKKDKNMTK